MGNKISYKDILEKVVKIWLLCYGAITAQVVAGYWASHIYLPYIGVLLIAFIILYGNHNLRQSSINCSMMTHYTVYTLLVSGVVMLIANLLNTNFITNKYSEFSHQEYPFHAAFIVYPVACVCYGIALLRRGNPDYCQACRTLAGYSVKESLRRNVLHHEGKFQLRFAFVLSLMVSIVIYAYYFMYYTAGTGGRRHSPDIFFMYIFPAVTYAMALIYMSLRYATMELEISLNMSTQDTTSRSTRLRYMVVWNDRLLLRDIRVEDDPIGLWDTPADKLLTFHETMSNHQAENTFKELSGHEDGFNLRRLFSSSHKEQNVFHYAAFIADDTPNPQGKLGGEWMVLRDVDTLLKTGHISRPFAVELHRVFTITMAWKTYDREGKRLYPIKNYRPTFRLRDFKTWDVDYEDMHWLSISENNQDKPFFKWRKFWRRYINGLDNRWDKTKS